MSDSEGDSELSSSFSSYSSITSFSELDSNALASYDDSLDPVATAEEAATYIQQVAIEDEKEVQFKKRFSGEVEVETW